MNLKHEMFWNVYTATGSNLNAIMNLKHEMFWNDISNLKLTICAKWTLNMKCFEILEKTQQLYFLANEP